MKELKPLSELATVVNYNNGDTNLHKLAIELKLLKDDNFTFQYNCVETDNAYKLYSPTNDCVLCIHKKVEDILQYCSYNVVMMLIKKGYLENEQ